MARKTQTETSTANLGFEQKLWLTADSRSAAETAEGNRSNNMDAAEYIRAERGRLPEAARRVGAGEVEDDGDPFEEKMQRLVAERHGQFAESAKLEAQIRQNLKGLGYGL